MISLASMFVSVSACTCVSVCVCLYMSECVSVYVCGCMCILHVSMCIHKCGTVVI